MPSKVLVTVDMEQDCPPFMSSFIGVEQGTPRLLALLRSLNISATFFTTGDVARRFPKVMHDIVANGHELGCHGDTHKRFSSMPESEAEDEIAAATAALRRYATPVSFRAPNLDFPNRYLPILASHGYRIDSSIGRYKPGSILSKPHYRDGLLRVPASLPPSLVRLPALLRDFFLSQLRYPIVFFFHPWEFVDATRWPIRLDCRFGTGQAALDTLHASVDHFRRQGATFCTMSTLAEHINNTKALIY